MNSISLSDSFLQTRYRAFKWRYELTLVNKIAIAIVMAVITGVLAQVKFPIPWTPVPITGQTFAVLLAGILLGKWWGGISQVIYVAIGIAGVPWFTNGNAGLGAFFGPTGGYLMGFILAALFIGYFSDKYIKARNFIPMLGIMLFSNFVLIYVPGLVQLGVWIHMVKGIPVNVLEIIMMGAVPFVVGDIIKILAAAAVTKAITPKEAFNNEADA